MSVPVSKIAACALSGLAMILPARAQDLPPFAINPERVHFMSANRCARAGTYIVPSLYLYVLARQRTSKDEKSSHRIFNEGLDKAQLQALSHMLYDDFVAKLRANGAKVLTYDDVRTDLAPLARKHADEDLGMPLRSSREDMLEFAVAAPSDEQAIDWDSKGITQPYRALAEKRVAAVIVPEISFTLPQSGTKSVKHGAREKISPSMVFSSGMMNGMPLDLRWCNIHVQEHTFRLAAENAGTLAPVSRAGPTGGKWSERRGDYEFAVDPQALRSGVLRAGFAFNSLMAEALKGE